MVDYKLLKGFDVAEKKVLVRVDYNVKVKNGKIEDDTRIKESLDTIDYLIKNNAKIILISHFGRPQDDLKKGKSIEEVRKKATLAPVAAHLGKLIKKDVKLAPDCIGLKVESLVNNMQNRDVLMLENLRLHKEEEANDANFAQSLANLCDIYIFDGFGVAHRAHASTAALPLYMLKQKKPVLAGFLMDKELKLWSEARKKQGYKLLVIGGAKLKEKTKAVSKLYKAVDAILVSGAICAVIMAGKGIDVGDSLVKEKDEDYTQKGKEIAEQAANLILAEKVVITKKDFSDIKIITTKKGIPKDYMLADIVIDGKIKKEVAKAQIIIWFGNIGMSDVEVKGKFPFAKGTEDFKKAVNKDTYVIVGGGDSVTASEGIPNRVISTGGGASIELYSKGTLDALEALKGNKGYFKK